MLLSLKILMMMFEYCIHNVGGVEDTLSVSPV